jgi:hypothetical protein
MGKMEALYFRLAGRPVAAGDEMQRDILQR